MKRKLQYGRFQFGPAHSESIKEKIFRLRYKVYVEEFAFEPEDSNPGGMETDEYDDTSIHFACLNPKKSVVSTLRLVTSSPNGFPTENIAKIDFIGRRPAESRIAEISRLAVNKKMMRSLPDPLQASTDFDSDYRLRPQDMTPKKRTKRWMNPPVVLGLYFALYQESRRRGITHWLMLTDKKVHRALKKDGYLFHQAGEEIWHHGWRTPYLGIIDEIERHMMRHNPELLQLMVNGLEEEYYPPCLIEQAQKNLKNLRDTARPEHTPPVSLCPSAAT